MPSVDICICTHNPRLDILGVTLRSIARQNAPVGAFQVFLIDNASNPKLTEDVLAPLTSLGIPAKIIREETPGIARARVRAIHASSAEWVLWVDDDNELFPDYVQAGLSFIKDHPAVGCFGGKLLLAPGLSPGPGVRPLLPYLGIKDEGEKEIIRMADHWGPWEPPTAGAWVKRPVLSTFAKNAASPDFFKLGRSGKNNLSSCEDSLMMRAAYYAGLSCAYVPSLGLYHHLSPARFNRKYLLRLLYAYGASHVVLETILHGYQAAQPWHASPWRIATTILRKFNHNRKHSLLYALAKAGHDIGYYREHKKQNKNTPPLFQSPAPKAPEPDILPKNMPKITLVTACRNAGATIERTLKSIELQGYPNLEYIVFDGASTDNTLDILKRYSHLTTKLVSEKDRNVADTYNKGFRHATGDIYCWLNADDDLLPGALMTVAKTFINHEDIDVVTGGCKRVFADGTTCITQVPASFLKLMAMRNDIEQPSTFWRASAHKKAGELDETFNLAFDWEWWNRLKATGAKFHVIPDVLSVYYFTDSNLTSTGGTRIIEEMYRVTKKYGPRNGLIADVYLFLFKHFDMHGYCDVPFKDLPKKRQFLLGNTLKILYLLFGKRRVNAYNWNWASKQIRGLVWYASPPLKTSANPPPAAQ